MPASQATAGYGTQFQHDPAGGTAYTTVAEVEDIAGPDGKWNKIDVSNMQSPGAVEEFILGMLSPGEVKLKLSYIPQAATQKAVLAAFAAKTKCGFNIIFTDAASSAWSFKGYYVNVGPSAPLKNKLMFEATVAVTGVVTFPS